MNRLIILSDVNKYQLLLFLLSFGFQSCTLFHLKTPSKFWIQNSYVKSRSCYFLHSYNAVFISKIKRIIILLIKLYVKTNVEIRFLFLFWHLFYVLKVDLARAYQSTPFDENEPEAEWVERERSQFRRFRDTNQDGRMDRTEVGEWIMPSNYDPIDAETKHLFYHADTNKVSKPSFF